ncbi:alpha/beta hydrolase [Lacticaseibacillus saniviri]|uniref:alpha/beta hydrolase n=1 Tax=Lacticaseibacillus saniviri TaxID=931533 RepID=UPI001EDCA9AB|nr:alpha/beta hydrolase [Lacticaseibacillus saniviri]MCG4281015.1 alpha/beta hydrolase [Lacticaseibacillus saniviri]
MRTQTVVIDADKATRLDVFLQEASPEMADQTPRPMVLVFPGGGYDFTSDREAEPIAMQFLAQGYDAAVLRYSVGAYKDFDAAFADGQFAIQTIVNHAVTWQIDVSRIAFIGFSAGGHLAASLTLLGDFKPAALLLGYPVILQSFGAFMNIEAPDLLAAVKPDLPPTFIFGTYSDDLVPVENSLLFAKALEQAEVPFELHLFQSGRHGLALGTAQTANQQPSFVEPAFAKWLDLATAWLRQRFAPAKPADKPQLTVREVMQDPELRAQILAAAPQLKDEHAYKIVRNMSIEEVLRRAPVLAEDARIQELLARLGMTQ